MFKEIIDMYNRKTRQTGFTKHYLTLFSIVEGLEAKNTFEFGTGISSKVILSALDYTKGTHTSCDIRNIDCTGLTTKYLENNKHRWTYLQQNSTVLTKQQLKRAGPFDFVLHDGSHKPIEVLYDIRKIIPFMKMDSILLIHDTLSPNESLLQVIIQALDFNEYELLSLPYGYGLTIVRIKKDFGNGHVIPIWKKNL